MSVKYDPYIIQSYANALYSRAARIVFMMGVVGLIAGVAVGHALGQMTHSDSFVMSGGFVGALVGLSLGRGRAFTLKLQAQSALCQSAIEANTRRPAVAVSSTEVPSTTTHRMTQLG